MKGYDPKERIKIFKNDEEEVNLLINFDFIDTYHSLTVPLQTLRYLRQNVSEAGQRAGLEDHSNVETNFTRQQFNTTLYLAAVFTVYLVGLAILLLDHARQEVLTTKPGHLIHEVHIWLHVI